MPTVTTRFEIDEYVYVIEDSDILKLRVVSINISNQIEYKLLKSKAATTLDKDEFIYRMEHRMFPSISSLASYYSNKLK